MQRHLSTSPWMILGMLAGMLGCLWWWDFSPPLATHQYLQFTVAKLLSEGHPGILAVQLKHLDALTQGPITQWVGLETWLTYLPQPQGVLQHLVFWVCLGIGLMGLFQTLQRLYRLTAFQMGWMGAALLICPALVFPAQLAHPTMAALMACWGLSMWGFSHQWCRGQAASGSVYARYPSSSGHSVCQYFTAMGYRLWVSLPWWVTLWLGGQQYGVTCFIITGLMLCVLAAEWSAQQRQRTPGRRPLSMAHWQWLLTTGALAIVFPLIIGGVVVIAKHGPIHQMLSNGHIIAPQLLSLVWHYAEIWPKALGSLYHTSLVYPWLSAFGWSLWGVGPMLLLTLMTSLTPLPLHLQRFQPTRWHWLTLGMAIVCLSLALALLPLTPWALISLATLVTGRMLTSFSATSESTQAAVRIVDGAIGLVLMVGIGWLLYVFYRLGDLYPGSTWYGWGTPSLDVLPLLFPVPIAIWKWWLVPVSVGCIGLAGLLYWAQTRNELWVKLASLWLCAMVFWTSWFGTIAPTFSRSQSPQQLALAHLRTLHPAQWQTTLSSAVHLQTAPDVLTLLNAPAKTPKYPSRFKRLLLLDEQTYLQRPPIARQHYKPLLQWRPYPLTHLPRGTQWGLFPIPFWQTNTALQAAPRIMLVAEYP